MHLDNWSHAVHSPPSLSNMRTNLSCRHCCCSYCAPALASSAYALALLRFRPPRAWCEALVGEVQRQMGAFGAQELSNLVWALAVLGLRPGRAWMRDFQSQVRHTRAHMCCWKLALLCIYTDNR
jgi:hypothetical protein